MSPWNIKDDLLVTEKALVTSLSCVLRYI
jgi:hypothetical protein